MIDGAFASPKVLASFAVANSSPVFNLVSDAAGELFFTTCGASSSYGSLFELVDHGGSCTSVAIGSVDPGGVIADAAGDVFEITGASGDINAGSIFEIPDQATIKES